jgi:hypothetical protein
MRDIRPDLLERKESIIKEIQSLEGEVRARRVDLDHTIALLTAEEKRWANFQQSDLLTVMAITPPDKTPGFRLFLRELFKDGKPRTTEEIRDQALGIKELGLDEKTAGRAVNFRLVGLERFGYVKREQNGKWILNGT